MYKAIKIKLSLSSDQEKILDQQSNTLNWLRNKLIEDNSKAYEDSKLSGKSLAKGFYNKLQVRNRAVALKADYPVLKTVYSSCIKNAALQLGIDYSNAFGRIRLGKKAGFPKFSSRKETWQPLVYEDFHVGYKIDFINDFVQVQLGKDDSNKRISMQLTFSEKVTKLFPSTFKIKVFQITKDLRNKNYYAVFSVEVADKPKKPVNKVIALDPNHKNVAYGVDSNSEALEIARLHHIKAANKRVDSINKKIKERKLKVGSNRREYLENVKRKIYCNQREQTKYALQAIANNLYKKYDLVAIGDYTPTPNSRVRKINRELSNNSCVGEFRAILERVAERSGKHFMLVPEGGTTRTCNSCGYIITEGIDPKIREWECSGCGFNHLRDENSAKNIFKRAVESFSFNGKVLSCSGHLEIKSRCTWRFDGHKVREKSCDDQIKRGIKLHGEYVQPKSK